MPKLEYGLQMTAASSSESPTESYDERPLFLPRLPRNTRELVCASASPKILNGLFYVRRRPLAAKTAPIPVMVPVVPAPGVYFASIRLKTDKPIPYVFGNTSEDTGKKNSMRSCRHGLFSFLRLHYTTRSVHKPLLKCTWYLLSSTSNP